MPEAFHDDLEGKVDDAHFVTRLLGNPRHVATGAENAVDFVRVSRMKDGEVDRAVPNDMVLKRCNIYGVSIEVQV